MGNTKRKKFAVYLITVISVILAAVLFMVGIGFFSYRSELVTVTATQTDGGDMAAGNAVYLKPDAVISSGFDGKTATGSSVRIVSIGADGVMTEKYSGIVTGYETARLGAITLLDDIRGLYGEDSIVKVRGFGGTVCALTQEGFILYDITSQQLAGRVTGNESFMDIACADSYVMAITLDGKIYL